MGIEYTNVAGVRKHYGARLDPASNPDPAPQTEPTRGNRVELEVNFAYDNLPAANDNSDAVVAKIPANSLIIAAYVYEGTAFDSTSGTTTIDLGLQEADGTEIDNDGIDVDVITADGSAGGWTVADGALVGATIGTTDGYIVATPSVSDLTAGKARLVVEYMITEG